jgi:hypothetical protein
MRTIMAALAAADEEGYGPSINVETYLHLQRDHDNEGDDVEEDDEEGDLLSESLMLSSTAASQLDLADRKQGLHHHHHISDSEEEDDDDDNAIAADYRPIWDSVGLALRNASEK